MPTNTATEFASFTHAHPTLRVLGLSNTRTTHITISFSYLWYESPQCVTEPTTTPQHDAHIPQLDKKSARSLILNSDNHDNILQLITDQPSLFPSAP